MFRRLLIAGALMLLASQSWGRVRTFTLNDSTITPANLFVLRGDTVRWTVVSGTHYLASDSASLITWNSDTLSGVGSSFDLVILNTDPLGVYPYHCSLHPNVGYQFQVIPGCCQPPVRGNMDYSVETGLPTYGINVQDLNYMVAYFFSGGPSPVCLHEADINGNGALGVIDLNYLVNYLFSGGPPPAACP